MGVGWEVGKVAPKAGRTMGGRIIPGKNIKKACLKRSGRGNKALTDWAALRAEPGDLSLVTSAATNLKGIFKQARHKLISL